MPQGGDVDDFSIIEGDGEVREGAETVSSILNDEVVRIDEIGVIGFDVEDAVSDFVLYGGKEVAISVEGMEMNDASIGGRKGVHDVDIEQIQAFGGMGFKMIAIRNHGFQFWTKSFSPGIQAGKFDPFFLPIERQMMSFSELEKFERQFLIVSADGMIFGDIFLDMIDECAELVRTNKSDI